MRLSKHFHCKAVVKQGCDLSEILEPFVQDIILFLDLIFRGGEQLKLIGAIHDQHLC